LEELSERLVDLDRDLIHRDFKSLRSQKRDYILMKTYYHCLSPFTWYFYGLRMLMQLLLISYNPHYSKSKQA